MASPLQSPSAPEPRTSKPDRLSRWIKIFFASVLVVLAATIVVFMGDMRTATISQNLPLQAGLIALAVLVVLVGFVIGFLLIFKGRFPPGALYLEVPLGLFVATVLVGFPAYLITTLIDQLWVVSTHRQEFYVVDHRTHVSHGRYSSTTERFLLRDSLGVETEIVFPQGASNHLTPNQCQILTLRRGALGRIFVHMDDSVLPGNPSCAERFLGSGR